MFTTSETVAAQWFQRIKEERLHSIRGEIAQHKRRDCTERRRDCTE